MRAVVQRVSEASVTVSGERVGEIGGGLLVLLGVAPDDGEEQLRWMAAKLANLRIFSDEQGKMNHSVLDLGLGMLVVSQFTLYGDCRKGRRPNFMGAAPGPVAEPLVDRFCTELARIGVAQVEQGRFGADMDVALHNDGPVTLVVDSP
jgi:D-tyrosyl-tRNA(Tyr) deacylase